MQRRLLSRYVFLLEFLRFYSPHQSIESWRRFYYHDDRCLLSKQFCSVYGRNILYGRKEQFFLCNSKKILLHWLSFSSFLFCFQLLIFLDFISSSFFPISFFIFYSRILKAEFLTKVVFELFPSKFFFLLFLFPFDLIT